jgi:hypothetical protein
VQAIAGALVADRTPSLPQRLLRVAIWIGGVALILFLLNLAGIPASVWIRDLFHKVGEVPA